MIIITTFVALFLAAPQFTAASAGQGPIEANALITSHSDGRVPRGSALHVTFANCGRNAPAAVTLVTGTTRTHSLLGYTQAGATGRVDLGLIIPLTTALGPARVHIDCYSSAGVAQRGIADFVVVERNFADAVLPPNGIYVPPYGFDLTVPAWPGSPQTLTPYLLLPPPPLARSGLSPQVIGLLAAAVGLIGGGVVMMVLGRSGRVSRGAGQSRVG